MKANSAIAIITGLALFFVFPVAFAYAVNACTPAQGDAAAQAIKLGAPIAEDIAKSACKELGADSTNEVVAIGCDIVEVLPDRANPDAGPAKLRDARPQKRYFFLSRADWARMQQSQPAPSPEGGK